MVVGSLTIDTDVVVIGAGPGGYVAAIRAAQLGKEVYIVDKAQHLGGVCLNHGCIPTKALIHGSNYYHMLEDLERIGIHIKEYDLNLKDMVAWKDGIIEKLRSGISHLLEKYGIEVVTGEAHFESETTLRISGQTDINTINFKHAIIATGSSPIEIPAFPFSHPQIISSREAVALQEIPKELVIIGGGYIGTEMGTVYGKLGSNVHIVEMGPELIPVISKEIVAVVRNKLQEFNIHVHTNSAAQSFEEKDGQLVVSILKDGQPMKLAADMVLVVVGRKPNSKTLGLENTSVTLDDHGFIAVDDQMRTTAATRNIFAIGDVVGQPMLAHKASYEGRVAAEVLSGKPSGNDAKVIPSVVFNDPEIASVGLTLEEAKEKGIDVISEKFPFAALGRALIEGETRGFVRYVADAKTHVILGWHAVGPQVGNLVSEATLAIEMGATLEDVSLTIHPHPTMSEVHVEGSEAVLKQAIHIFQHEPKN